jgi:hypothetical protein
MKIPDRNQYKITFNAEEKYFFGKAKQRYGEAEKYIAGVINTEIEKRFHSNYILTWSDDLTRRLAKRIGGVFPARQMTGRIVIVLATDKQDAVNTYAHILTTFKPLKIVIVWLNV